MSGFDTPSRRIFSVSELNNETKQLLEQRFFSIFVRGEVSNISAPRSGHWYFTIKDDAAQIRVVMFKQANFRHKLPALGDELIVGGQLSFYRERGEVQIIANQIRPAGLGDLQQQFEQLKKKLLDEGIFEQSRKQPIPSLPKKVAVITSPTGAVIQDIVRICARRASSLPILLVPVSVQGQNAEEEICLALEQINSRKDIDLVILARGGGSLEDFVAFNSESVARAISASSIPVISGVGHETDTSIADFVADLRAATPSEAAELATAGFEDVKKRMIQNLKAISLRTETLYAGHKNEFEKLSLRLKNPADEVLQISQKLDHLESQLTGYCRASLAKYQMRLIQLGAVFEPDHLIAKINTGKQHLSQLNGALRREVSTSKKLFDSRFARALGLLDALNPLSTMTRGYSIVFDTDDRVIHSVRQLSEQQKIKVKFKDGIAESDVRSITPDSD